MRPITLAALVAALAAAAPTYAADKADIEKRYSVIYTDCIRKAGSTADYLSCISAEQNWQNKYLNRRYAELKSTLTPPQRARLEASQRAWNRYRDQWCAAQQDAEWGSASRIEAAQCLVDQTIARTIELERYPPEA